MQETQIPSLGQEDPRRRKWQTTLVFLSEKSHEQSSLMGYSPWGQRVRHDEHDYSRPHGLQPTRLLHLWDFPGKSTGVGCYCLLRHTLKGLLKKKEDYYDHVYFILFFFMTMFKLNFFILLLHCFHYDFESQRE